MNATQTAIPALSDFRPLLLRARERSSALGRPVLASLSTQYNGAWPSLDAADECVSWEKPARGLRFLGIGSAAAIEASGANRFGHVREGLARLLAEAVVDGLADVSPLALAGFAFDPQLPQEERWAAFPDGLAVLPRILFACRDGATSLTFNALVSASGDPEVIQRDLQHTLESALRSSSDAEMPYERTIRDVDGPQHWLDSVTALTESIAAGEAEKVVLARRVCVKGETPWLLEPVRARLAQRYAECSVFAVRRGEACFIGAAPETLVSLQGGTLRIDCLAGSYPRGATKAEDAALGEALLASDKDRREHAFVARAICEALSGVCTDLQMPETPSLRRFANVQHLHTPIEARVDAERHVLDLVERLHPTPAVAGLPRDHSLCLIRRHEPFSRGWYAGPLGWLDANGDGEFAVALRSGLVRGNEASLYAGCGIVRGSDPAREYDESAIKLQAMLWALDAVPQQKA